MVLATEQDLLFSKNIHMVPVQRHDIVLVQKQDIALAQGRDIVLVQKQDTLFWLNNKTLLLSWSRSRRIRLRGFRFVFASQRVAFWSAARGMCLVF